MWRTADHVDWEKWERSDSAESLSECSLILKVRYERGQQVLPSFLMALLNQE